MIPHIFSEIEQMHAEWAKMDSSTKIAWLTKEKLRLSRLANQMAQHISANGGLMNDSERTYARKLLEMIQSIDDEGRKVLGDIRSDAFKEMVKAMM